LLYAVLYDRQLAKSYSMRRAGGSAKTSCTTQSGLTGLRPRVIKGDLSALATKRQAKGLVPGIAASRRRPEAFG
jgi:hypothetical protein